MVKSIHQSSLGMMIRCAEAFRRRYIEGEKVPPSIAMARGTAVHRVNEENLSYKQISEADLPVNDMTDVARDSYYQAFEPYGGSPYLTREEKNQKDKLMNEGLNDAVKLTGLYANQVAPTITKVIAIEHEFKIDLGVPGITLPIAGRIDYTNDISQLSDLKTVKRSWAEGQIEKELQPIFYSIAHEVEHGMRPRFVYNILVALKKEAKLQVQDIVISDRQLQILVTRLVAFCKALETGTFLPADMGHWFCSEKYCGYYQTCKFVGN